MLTVVLAVYIDSEPTVEFRGVFMATVANMDWPRSPFESSIIQLSELVQYVEMMSTVHINAVMFQVRTAGDAFYDSNVEPWSKYIQGGAIKTGPPAILSHCKYSENSVTELHENWWTSAILYAEHSH